MGLDSVEIVLSCEETFQISIPDQEAEKMFTPRQVIDFITTTLGTRVEAPAIVMTKRHDDIWAQMVRAMRSSGIAIEMVTMDQRLDDVFADRSARRRHWRELRRQMNAQEWPPLRWLGLSTDFPNNLQTLGDLVEWLSCNRRQILTAEERQALTREDVAMLVKYIVSYQLSLPKEKYGEDKRFIEDMGMN